MALLSLGLPAHLRELRQSVPLVGRIPKGARVTVANALSKTIRACIKDNDAQSWEELLVSPYRFLHLPPENGPGKEKVSLTSAIKRNCGEIFVVPKYEERKASTGKNHDIKRAVDRKFNEAAVSRAVDIITSEDTIAPVNEQTLAAMKEKHPSEPVDSDYGADPFTLHPKVIPPEATPEEVFKTIQGFPNGSAGGIDGLRPQHLKDLLGTLDDETAQNLLKSITELINVMLSGEVPSEICPVLYGATLTALRKKDGGLRPIAVGITFRRLAAKVVSRRLVGFAKILSENHQYGFGVDGGAEAIVHSARNVITSDSNGCSVFVKVDCKNAFNTIRRDKLLKIVESSMPEYYRFIWQNYRRSSHLFFGKELLQSACGVQQGDPLGPLLFSLITIEIDKHLESPFRCSYLDDLGIGGSAFTVATDLLAVKEVGLTYGLELNPTKCEVFAYGGDDQDRAVSIEFIKAAVPEIRITPSTELVLLGSPLLPEAVPLVLEEKTRKARLMAERLPILASHQALFLLKNCLSMPKVLYTLRTAPTWPCLAHLSAFDNVIRNAFSTVCNVEMGDEMWAQATLPVANGGMGFRQTAELSLPAFLASAHSVCKLVAAMVAGCVVSDVDEVVTMPAVLWSEHMDQPCPPEEQRGNQRAWDQPMILKKQQQVLENADTKNKARLLAVSTKESGLWLNVVPMSSMGTLLDDSTLRIAVGLRLGATLCGAHFCGGCGKDVDVNGHHGLSCKFSAGRSSRHSAINQTVQRALTSAGLPSIMEPPGLDRGNGKRPDGLTLVPWSHGNSAVWDVTIVDTVCQSYVRAASQTAGHAANAAEARKTGKYRELVAGRYLFVPVGFETMGSWGVSAKEFIRDIGKRITERTGEVRATSFLRQRVSLDLQRGNAASVLGTLPKDKRLDCIYHILDAKAPTLA